MNKRSIATVSLSGALDEKLRAIAAAGFDAVEIFENDLLSFSGSPRDVGQMCRDLGLSICAFQPFRDFEFSRAAADGSTLGPWTEGGLASIWPSIYPALLELVQEPARDERYFLSSFYWPDIVDPSYAYGHGVRLQLRSAISHLNEVWAVDRRREPASGEFDGFGIVRP